MEGMLNYFIPEDGDSSDHLNVVPLPRVEQLKLQHVKKVRTNVVIHVCQCKIVSLTTLLSCVCLYCCATCADLPTAWAVPLPLQDAL